MEKLQLFLLIVQVIIAVVMIIAVLLQKSDGDSLSGIGGSSAGGLGSVISSKASANILTKIIMILSGLFMLNCLILATISSKVNKSSKLQIDKILEEQNKSGSQEQKAPAVPPVE